MLELVGMGKGGTAQSSGRTLQALRSLWQDKVSAVLRARPAGHGLLVVFTFLDRGRCDHSCSDGCGAGGCGLLGIRAQDCVARAFMACTSQTSSGDCLEYSRDCSLNTLVCFRTPAGFTVP